MRELAEEVANLTTEEKNVLRMLLKPNCIISLWDRLVNKNIYEI
jgi:hypothetical protein